MTAEQLTINDRHVTVKEDPCSWPTLYDLKNDLRDPFTGSLDQTWALVFLAIAYGIPFVSMVLTFGFLFPATLDIVAGPFDWWQPVLAIVGIVIFGIYPLYIFLIFACIWFDYGYKDDPKFTPPINEPDGVIVLEYSTYSYKQIERASSVRTGI